MTPRGAPSLCVLLVALSAKLAASEPVDTAAAKRYVEAANQAYRLGRYALALRAYEEAHRIAPLPALTFSMAQAHRLAYYQDHDPDHLKRALELYRRYLVEAPHGNRRGHATLHIEAIEGLLGAETAAPPEPPPSPTELLVVSRTPGARGRIDGSDYLELPFDRRVAAGKRWVEVEAPGYARTRSAWRALEGRLVVAQVDLLPLPAAVVVSAPAGSTVSVDGRALEGTEATLPAGAHVVSVTASGRKPAVRQLSLAPGERRAVAVPRLELTEQRVAAHWTLGGAGVLALAGGVTTLFALAAEERVREYDSGIGAKNYDDGERAERNRALGRRDDFRTASIVLFGAAAAAGVTGGALWLFDGGASAPTQRAVVPFVGPKMGGASWGTVF